MDSFQIWRVSSLLAYPTDFGLASLHNHLSQILNINFHSGSVSLEPWLIYLLQQKKYVMYQTMTAVSRCNAGITALYTRKSCSHHVCLLLVDKGKVNSVSLPWEPEPQSTLLINSFQKDTLVLTSLKLSLLISPKYVSNLLISSYFISILWFIQPSLSKCILQLLRFILPPALNLLIYLPTYLSISDLLPGVTSLFSIFPTTEESNLVEEYIIPNGKMGSTF